jgi:atypical dual specificity phosphatase
MMTPGHHQIPSEDCYQKFAKAVGQFLEENKNNGKIISTIGLYLYLFHIEKLIGVHCTHGLNRTGYLIVR